jgi:hypothetical protein
MAVHTTFGGLRRRAWLAKTHQWVRAADALGPQDLPPFPVDPYITNVIEITGREGAVMVVTAAIRHCRHRLPRVPDPQVEQELLAAAMVEVDRACAKRQNVAIPDFLLV